MMQRFTDNGSHLSQPFVHLHVHSEYSLLDGLSRISDLVQQASDLGMPAIALTDHGVLFGAVDFYQKAHDAGIKPIIGVEAYVAARSMAHRDSRLDRDSYHLLLLAENNAGYQNLLRIASASQLDGFYYVPRIDHEFLAGHAEGLIATTGCLSGEVPRALLHGEEEMAVELLDFYYEVFGRDNYFFELQHHPGVPELDGVNKQLLDLADRYQARFVATNDVHYVRPEDAHLQDILLCIQTNSLLTDLNRMSMPDQTFYLRSGREMHELFGHIPDAIENTLRIAERCNVKLDFGTYHLPKYVVPEGRTAKSYLRHLCEEGLRVRYGSRSAEPSVSERLDHELSVIHRMGFDDYFIIVWDLVCHAQEEGIWYNARGSAAGSIVAYCLGITILDPLEHGLIFERFLNPERISMPDIDLDFQDDRRSEMLAYVSQKYSRCRVAQIITFGTLGARAAIRDVGRVMDIPLSEVDRIAKMVPSFGSYGSIDRSMQDVEAFREEVETNPVARELASTAAQLEGMPRNSGTHAAGVVITPGPLVEYVPLHRPTGTNGEESPIQALTQYEMSALDAIGLLKVDILGLSTLAVMERACRMIRDRHGVDLDLTRIPLDEPNAFELLGRGEVVGVFQLEGSGMRRYLMEMKPKELSHVIAMVALFRPGPMEFIPSYIRRMHGDEDVSYLHPTLEPIFRETYGIPVYQEQIMFAAMELAGYSAADADYLRKAISKKEAGGLKEHREKFVQGAAGKGIPPNIADQIFSDWENFARYGFNRAHAAAYGAVAVQTAYLKAKYPIEYMTALMSVFRENPERTAGYITDCRRMGIGVLRPSVNKSGLDFTIEASSDSPEAIRYGLGGIKTVGDGAAAHIVEARELKGEFSDVVDFALRVDLRRVGKRALESLIKAGALDDYGPRSALLDQIDQLSHDSGKHHQALSAGQMTLFAGESNGISTNHPPDQSMDVSKRQQLAWERELLGVYVSDHPVASKMDILGSLISHYSSEIQDASQDELVIVAGEIAQIRTILTRRDEQMAFVSLEDLQGEINLVIFPKLWADVFEWMEEGLIVVAKGKVDHDRGDPKVLVDKITDQIERVKLVSNISVKRKKEV